MKFKLLLTLLLTLGLFAPAIAQAIEIKEESEVVASEKPITWNQLSTQDKLVIVGLSVALIGFATYVLNDVYQEYRQVQQEHAELAKKLEIIFRRGYQSS